MIPTAVVFDCDGVLVDSEPHSSRSWLEVLARYDHPGTEADIRACTGLGFRPTLYALASVAPLPEAEVVWPVLMDALRRSFEGGLTVFDDALCTLDAVIAAGVPVAVASSSPRERLDLTLEVACLTDRFAVSVAGDEVAAGKPDPDVYLAALDGLGVGNIGSMAIEDSMAGVAAARAAGLGVVAVVRDEISRGELIGAGAAVVDLLSPADVGL